MSNNLALAQVAAAQNQKEVTIGTGVSAGSFATSGGGAETFAAGDRLAIINENPADATLADLSIIFVGKRT